MYAVMGRPSIPPERLLRASALIALYPVRSERAFCEELDRNLLFRRLLDMRLMEPSFDQAVLSVRHQKPLLGAKWAANRLGPPRAPMPYRPPFLRAACQGCFGEIVYRASGWPRLEAGGHIVRGSLRCRLHGA